MTLTLIRKHPLAFVVYGENCIYGVRSDEASAVELAGEVYRGCKFRHHVWVTRWEVDSDERSEREVGMFKRGDLAEPAQTPWIPYSEDPDDLWIPSTGW